MYLDATEFSISSRALMIAQISVVYMDAESGNLKEIMVFDGKTSASQRTPILWSVYKQECNHSTCLEFPWIIAYKQMNLCHLSSDVPDPAKSSVVWYSAYKRFLSSCLHVADLQCALIKCQQMRDVAEHYSIPCFNIWRILNLIFGLSCLV